MFSVCRTAPEQIRTSTRANDLGFTSPLALRSHGQAVLKLLAKDDVLDKHALDCYTPACRRLFNDLADRLCNLLATLDDILENAGADDVAEGRLGTLNERNAKVGDAESGLVWADDVVVDDRREREIDIVLGHAHLLWDL